MMTKYSRIIMIAAWTFLAVALATSCQSRQSRKQSMSEEDAYLSSLTAADTAALIAKADSCIALMVAGQMDEALANVGYVEDATLKHLTPEMVARTAATFKSLGVHGFERSGFELTNSELNTISYRLKIGGPSSVPEPVEGTATPTVGEPSRTTDGPSTSSGIATPTTGFAFNAYRIDGHWYLTLKQ